MSLFVEHPEADCGGHSRHAMHRSELSRDHEVIAARPSAHGWLALLVSSAGRSQRPPAEPEA
jgi:hypothetical protein